MALALESRMVAVQRAAVMPTVSRRMTLPKTKRLAAMGWRPSLANAQERQHQDAVLVPL
jgi:hypothetical protein